jgi:hypothetical protein
VLPRSPTKKPTDAKAFGRKRARERPNPGYVTVNVLRTRERTRVVSPLRTDPSRVFNPETSGVSPFFVLYLPRFATGCTYSVQTQTRMLISSGLKQGTKKREHMPHTILLIDDSPTIRNIVKIYLMGFFETSSNSI